MSLSDFLFKTRRKIMFLVFIVPLRKLRVLKYKLLSRCNHVTGVQPCMYQPVLFEGCGTIKFHNDVILGVPRSPFFYTGYIYMDVREDTSKNSFWREGYGE